MKQTGETLHAGSKHTVVYSKGMERTSCTGVSLPTSNILGPCISSKRTAQAMLALLHMSSLQSGISLTCNVPAKGFIPARLERRAVARALGMMCLRTSARLECSVFVRVPWCVVRMQACAVSSIDQLLLAHSDPNMACRKSMRQFSLLSLAGQ
eukprot:scaffold5613_cov19-Tisochrysis_lutea.AAC.3